nr:hypothetical protein Iba_chr06cCG1500 [Ipomoea batatas]
MLGTRSGSTAIASGSIPNSVSLDACHGSGNKAEGFTKADSIPFPSISNSNLACMSKGREWKSASNTAMTLFNETETEENFVRASQFNCKKPGVTSQTTTVDGFTIGTPATCIAPESVMIASAAMMPLGPAPKSPLLVQNHFDGSPL